jgi:hypothetical protein
MLHACVQKFDVTGNRENILGWDGEVNKALQVWAGMEGTKHMPEGGRPRNS